MEDEKPNAEMNSRGKQSAESDWMDWRAITDSDGRGDKPGAKAAPPTEKEPMGGEDIG